MPPNGLVIKGIPTPLATTIKATIIFIKKRKYGEISNLSSITPTTREIKEAKKRAITIFEVKGKNNIPAINIPTKRGMPPLLGIGFLWIMAGCLCTLGSSKIPNRLIKTNDMGVIIDVTTNATTKDKKEIIRILIE